MKSSFLKQTILFIVTITCLNISFAQKSASKNATSSSSSGKRSYVNVSGDGNAGGEAHINYTHGSDRYSLKMVGDKVTELYVNDKKIPADSIHLYNSVIDKIKEQLKKDRAQAEEDRKQAEKDRAQALLDRAQAEKDRQQAEGDRKQAERDREQANKERQRAETDRKQGDADRLQANKDREQAEKDRQQAMKDREQANEDRKQAQLDRKQAEKDRKQAEEDRALVRSLVEQLVKDGIVSDEKALTSFELSSNEFTVNGKKQPEAIHNSYKSKYLKKSGTRMSYGITMSGTFMNVDAQD